MLAANMLVSLALLAAMPGARSRHTFRFNGRVFPDDPVEPRFPPRNIENLQIPEIGEKSDVEEPQNIEDEADFQGKHSKAEGLNSYGKKVNEQHDYFDVRDLKKSGNQVNDMDDDFEIQDWDNTGNPVNTQKENRAAKVEDDFEEEEPDVPANIIDTKKQSVLEQEQENLGDDTPDDESEVRNERNLVNDEVPDFEDQEEIII